VTDARMLAQQLVWAATTPAAHRQAYNISNGDLFRWRWLWPQIAAYFGVEWQGPPAGGTLPLEPRMKDAAQRWRALAAKHGLAEPDVYQLASWWHTDGDLGRVQECVNDMTESRLRGFCGFQSTPFSFFDLFGRLRARIGTPSPAERLEHACAALAGDRAAVDLPARVSLFGLTRLSAAELSVLRALASEPTRVFTREELMNHLWKGTFYGDLRSVDVHVRHLRQKIERTLSKTDRHCASMS